MLLTNAWKAVERAKVDIHISSIWNGKKTVIIYRASVNSNANKLYSLLVAISAMSTLWKQQESHFFGQFSSHTDEGLCILRNKRRHVLPVLLAMYTGWINTEMDTENFHSHIFTHAALSTSFFPGCWQHVLESVEGGKIPLLFLFLEITHGDMFRLFAGAEAWCHSRFT